MVNLDNSQSLLPDYVDTEALKQEATMKNAAFSSASDAWTPAAVIRVAQGDVGATANINTGRTTMEAATLWYSTQNATLKTAMSTASSESNDYVAAFNAKKAELELLRKKVEGERELAGIRDEQVKSLENREAANFHSSWLGLDRPLTEAGRIGLWVATGIFALLAIVGTFVLYRARGVTYPDAGYFFRGGFRSLLRQIRYSL